VGDDRCTLLGRQLAQCRIHGRPLRAVVPCGRMLNLGTQPKIVPSAASDRLADDDSVEPRPQLPWVSKVVTLPPRTLEGRLDGILGAVDGARNKSGKPNEPRVVSADECGKVIRRVARASYRRRLVHGALLGCMPHRPIDGANRVIGGAAHRGDNRTISVAVLHLPEQFPRR
jgi:hypothetical protein